MLKIKEKIKSEKIKLLENERKELITQIDEENLQSMEKFLSLSKEAKFMNLQGRIKFFLEREYGKYLDNIFIHCENDKDIFYDMKKRMRDGYKQLSSKIFTISLKKLEEKELTFAKITFSSLFSDSIEEAYDKLIKNIKYL